MSKFKPYYGKVEVRPLEKDNIILSEQESLIECGEVIGIGDSLRIEGETIGYQGGFVKLGDLIFFDAWKMGVAVEKDGTKHYVVSLDGAGILGKIENE